MSQTGTVTNTGQSQQRSGSADVINFDIKGQPLTYVECESTYGEQLRADAGCVLAVTSTIQIEIARADLASSIILGGNALIAHPRGPGKVCLRPLPFSRLDSRGLANAGPAVGTGEGATLAPTHKILDGDNQPGPENNKRPKRRFGLSSGK